VATAAENEDWRRKYFDSVRAVEQDERRYREQLQTLRKLVSRLCLAAQEQSPRLDAELRKLKEAIGHDPVQPAELEKIGGAITDAVKELDHGTATLTDIKPPVESRVAPATVGVNDGRVRDILSRLLNELRRDLELVRSVDALDSELANPMKAEQLPSVLERTGGLAAQRIRSLEKARNGLETLLDQMVARLDEIAQFVAGQDSGQQQESVRREAFSTQIAGEMQAIGESVDSGADIGQIRLQLRSRLDSIGRHLQEFRQRETGHAREAHERSEKMRARVEELEGEARKLHQSLVEEKRLSMLDPLTQIPNRLAWEQRVTEEVDRWQRFAQPTCLVAWDIDRFKNVNDSYGHAAGDKVLKIVAECLAGRIRSTDFLARYGGEEFVMILPGTTIDDGARLVDQLRDAVSRVGFHFRSTPVSVTISGGITALRAGDSTADAFDRADKAMYEAKETGRNRVVSA
jgi:diguanylate cyclase